MPTGSYRIHMLNAHVGINGFDVSMRPRHHETARTLLGHIDLLTACAGRRLSDFGLIRAVVAPTSTGRDADTTAALQVCIWRILLQKFVAAVGEE